MTWFDYILLTLIIAWIVAFSYEAWRHNRANRDPCKHPQATVNHQGIYTCPDCWHRVPAPSDSDPQVTS